MVNIAEPAEPTDIFWENLHFSSSQKKKRKALANFLTLLVLGLCGLFVYLLTVLEAMSSIASKHDAIENSLATGDGEA